LVFILIDRWQPYNRWTRDAILAEEHGFSLHEFLVDNLIE
jgi:hypothetical protein